MLEKHFEISQKELGKALKLARKKARLTQQEVSELIGLTRNFVCLVENGHKTPSLISLEKIANAYHIPQAYLLLLATLTPNGKYTSEIEEAKKKISQRYLGK